MSRPRGTPRGPAPSGSTIPSVEAIEDEVLEELEPVEADAHQAVEAIAHPPRRGIRWGALALATGGAIVVARDRRRLRLAGARSLRPRRLARLARRSR